MKQNFNFKGFLKLAINKLVLLLFIILFVIVFSAIFGGENQLIGVGLITGLIMFYNIDLGLNNKQAPFIILGICILMAMADVLNIVNIYLGIIANMFTIFIFMSLSTVNLIYKTYIPFVLIYIFAKATPITQEQIDKRILCFVLCGILLTLVYYIKHRKLENGKTIKDIVNSISISEETTVFNIKMALGLTVAMFLTQYFNITKGMWIHMSVMSLTQPHFHMTKERIKHRFLGTIIGIVGFLILFEGLIPDKYLGIITAILTYAYTFIKSYHIQMIFVTINSLNAADGIFDTSFHSTLYRLMFVFSGIIIVLLVALLEKLLDKKVKHYPDDDIDNNITSK